jgi:SAM-dependent methyltransferase
MKNKNFDYYSEFYDLLYSDKDYELESNYVIKLVEKQCSAINSALELGCGSGSHAMYLSKYWKNLVGLDISPKMIEIANSKQIPNFSASVSDITNFNLETKFDVVISLFHVFSYLKEDIDIINCLECVNRHLLIGGVFFFDFWYTPAVYSIGPDIKFKNYENESLDVSRISIPTVFDQSSIVNVDFKFFINRKSDNTISTLSECHIMRHFTLNEIALFAKLCGFELVDSREFMTFNNLSINSWGACVTLKKIKNL